MAAINSLNIKNLQNNSAIKPPRWEGAIGRRLRKSTGQSKQRYSHGTSTCSLISKMASSSETGSEVEEKGVNKWNADLLLVFAGSEVFNIESLSSRAVSRCGASTGPSSSPCQAAMSRCQAAIFHVVLVVAAPNPCHFPF